MDQSDPLFSKKGSFAEVFPSIESCVIEVERPKRGPYGEKEILKFTETNPPGEYVDCTNPKCYGGGFSIGIVLRKAVKNNDTNVNTSGLCKGQEGSPKGAKLDRDCMSHFSVAINIKYKSDN